MSPDPSIPLETVFSGPDAPSEQDMYKCVHCGFCLQACPTYLQTGLETESPRGRIALMKAVNEGRIGITPGVFRHWDLCIQCRACEVSCPSGVPYGRLIEATMGQVERHRNPPLVSKFFKYILLRHILPRQGILSILVKILRFYQQSGAQRAFRKSRALQIFFARMAKLEKASPQVPATTFKALGQVIPSQHGHKAKVALVSGCIMPLVHGPQMDAVVRVLTRNGCEVMVPSEQVCCGAINTHVGDLEKARDLARQNINAFLITDADAIIVASAGCGIRMKEYHDLLKDDSEYANKALELSSIVKDIHEFLVDLPFRPPKGRLDIGVTYQDSCHLSHAQRITNAPRILLRSIPGLKLVETSNSTRCCGAGGTYMLTQRESSLRLLNSKMREIEDTETEIVATANPGCMLQLQYGVRQTNSTMQVKYITDILDEAYGSE